VAVNASDVLCSYGDIDGLMAFWSATSAQTCGMNVCNLSRNRCAKVSRINWHNVFISAVHKLRPTISEVQESHPEYVPSFLPLLPKHSSLITDGRFQRTEYRDNAVSTLFFRSLIHITYRSPHQRDTKLGIFVSRADHLFHRTRCAWQTPGKKQN
jgi:hypothetical protein